MRHMSDLDSSDEELSSRAEFYFGKHLSKTVQKGGNILIFGEAQADSIFLIKALDEISLRISLPKGLQKLYIFKSIRKTSDHPNGPCFNLKSVSEGSTHVVCVENI